MQTIAILHKDDDAGIITLDDQTLLGSQHSITRPISKGMGHSFLPFLTTRFPPAIISCLSFWHQLGFMTGRSNQVVTRRALLLITSNYYLPSKPKDQSTMRAENSEQDIDNAILKVGLVVGALTYEYDGRGSSPGHLEHRSDELLAFAEEL